MQYSLGKKALNVHISCTLSIIFPLCMGVGGRAEKISEVEEGNQAVEMDPSMDLLREQLVFSETFYWGGFWASLGYFSVRK